MNAPVFIHQQAAHCESGAASALLRHHGLPYSEAMVFGLSSALSFAYIPLVKINELPLIAYRMPPRFIVNGLRKLLKLPLRFETFRDPQRGLNRLNQLIDEGKLVGLQTSVFFLPYFPVNMRFHFNAHNLLAYGRDGDELLLSDPVFEHSKRCKAADLQKARFVKGVLAPKGLLYYMDGDIPSVDIAPLIPKAIKKTCNIMLYTPLPFVGARGIKLLANKVLSLQGKKDDLYIRRYVGHIVRMQEEIGTGGAGFRFLYAAFLQEAATICDHPEWSELAKQLTAIGDEWREFALHAARMAKGRSAIDVTLLHQQLIQLSQQEDTFFRKLRKTVA